MSALDKFLATSPAPIIFAEAAWEAALEIARGDGFGGLRNGLDNRASSVGWLDWDNPVREYLMAFLQHWREGNRGLFFRGSKMPDPAMGSFHFENGEVHVTPWTQVALGYAKHFNNSVGVGRLLKFGDHEYAPSLGFFSVWDVSMQATVWGNFQYEDFLKNRNQASKLSVQNLFDAVKQISTRPLSEFDQVKTPEGHTLASPVQRSLASVYQSYYEACVPQGSVPRELFLQGRDVLIKINPENPQWDQWMARIQEVNLRDFYEFLPLENAVTAVEGIRDRRKSMNSLSPDGLQAAGLILQQIESTIHHIRTLPWTCHTMEEAKSLAKAPHIRQSARVGSGTGDRVYPPHVQRIQSLQEMFFRSKYDQILEEVLSPELTSSPASTVLLASRHNPRLAT